MTKVIAFANQKGGVAKTTSAVALAQSLAMEGKSTRVLAHTNRSLSAPVVDQPICGTAFAHT